MEFRHRIRAWRARRVAYRAAAPADPYAQALATASHLTMLRRSMTGEHTPARWYR